MVPLTLGLFSKTTCVLKSLLPNMETSIHHPRSDTVASAIFYWL